MAPWKTTGGTVPDSPIARGIHAHQDAAETREN